jgi:hypothetical protein
MVWHVEQRRDSVGGPNNFRSKKLCLHIVERKSEIIMYAWHYCNRRAFDLILKSGRIKSRELLISEKLQQRPDWDDIRTGKKPLEEVLPSYMLGRVKFLSRRPIVNFSRQQHWERQAGEQTENKFADLSPTEWPAHDDTRLTMKQAHQHGGGLVRLGMSEDRLTPWGPELFLKAQYPLWQCAAEYVVDGWGLHSVNRRMVMAYVGDSLPLDKIERIDLWPSCR